MIGNVSLLHMNLKNIDSFIILGIPICKHEMSLKDKYTWRYSFSRVIREIKMKVSVATRMVKMKKHKNTKCCSENPLEYTLLTDGMQFGATSVGCLAVPSAAEHTRANQWAIPALEWPCAYRHVPHNSPGNGPMSISSRNDKTHFVVPSQLIKKKQQLKNSLEEEPSTPECNSMNRSQAMLGKTSWLPLRKVKKRESTPHDEAGSWWSWWGRVTAGGTKGLC